MIGKRKSIPTVLWLLLCNSALAAAPPSAPTLVTPSPSFFGPLESYTEIFYVTQSGMGRRDGSSRSDAWSVSDFNDSNNWSSDNARDTKIGPNDLVWISGEITSRIVPAGGGTTSAPVVVAGGDTIAISPQGSEAPAIDLRDANNIRFLNPFRRGVIDGGVTEGSINDSLSGNAVIRVDRSSGVHFDNWEIRNGWTAIRGAEVSDFTITNSYIHHMRQSGIHLLDSRRIMIKGNELYRCTYKTGGTNIISADIRLFRNKDTIISHNRLHATPGEPADGWGMIGIALYRSTRSVIEYNSIHDHGAKNKRSSIHVKSSGGAPGSQGVIRFNNIYNQVYVPGWSYTSDGSGIALTRNNEVYWIYGNRISNSESGIMVDINAARAHSDGGDGHHVRDIYIWGNVLSDISGEGIRLNSGWSGNTDYMYNIFVVNNTLHKIGDLGIRAYTRLGVEAPPQLTIKNNIFSAFGNKGQYPHHFWTNQLDHERIDWSHNIYFDGLSSQRPYVRIGWKSEHECWPDACLMPLPWFSSSRVDDPGFVSASRSEFSLLSGSPAVGAGARLEKMPVERLEMPFYSSSALMFSFDDVLSPGTDFEVHPPNVLTGKQGEIVEIGAFTYSP